MKRNLIFKNRFLTWLMWIAPIACTGWHSALAWTLIQLFIYNKEMERSKKVNTPLSQRPEYIEMNKRKNLSADEIFFLDTHPGMVKVGRDDFRYDKRI